MKTANSISKHFTRAHTIYTVAASASTESPVFGEFVRNNLEEEMYDSLLLYATEECSLVKDYMGEECTGRYVPMLSRWGDAANPPQEDVQHVRQGLPGGCV